MSKVDSLIFRRAGLFTILVGAVCTIIGGFTAGAKGVIGGIVATAIVIVFFAAGQAILGRTLENNPQMALTVALTVYLVKIGVLLILLLLLQNTTMFDTKIFAVTIVACTIAWTIAEVWVFSTTKVLYVEPDRKP